MGNILEICNDYSYLVTKDYELKEKMWKTLRFRNRNYWHNRKYKCGLWDGFTNFFDRKTGKFLTGLLPEVEFILRCLKKSYKKNDKRNLLEFQHTNVDDQFLNQWLTDGKTPVTLEDYQVDLINQAIKYRRGIVQAPTGSGKTLVMIGILKALPPNTPTLVLGNRLAINGQNYDALKEWNFPNLGRLDSTVKNPNVITCANVLSLKHIESALPDFKALIVDEIHLLMTNSAIRAYKKLKNCSVRIAVSATPFKFGEKDKVQKYTTKGFFGPVLKTKVSDTGIVTTNFLQERGKRLSPSICTFYYVDKPYIPYDLYQDAVTNGIAESDYFNNLVARLVKGRKGRIMVLVERIAQGDTLHRLIPNSVWIQGKDNEKTRKYVLEQLRKSKETIVTIATQHIFSVGVDVWLHNLVNAAGGKAEHDITQRMGRGLRTASDKDTLYYWDFIFRNNEYLQKHSYQRVKILKNEKHKVIIKDKIDF